MEWINEKAKTLSQGAIRAMFDRANKMTDVISLGIGEPDMTTPKATPQNKHLIWDIRTIPPMQDCLCSAKLLQKSLI